MLAQYDVSRVGDESQRLSEDEHRVESEDAVIDDDTSAHKVDDPEAHGQHRRMVAVAVVPLVDESHGEDDLSGGAEDEEPQRHVLVVEQMHEELRTLCTHGDGNHGQGGDGPLMFRFHKKSERA